MKFTIDEAFLTSVSKTKVYYRSPAGSEDNIIDVLSGKGECKSFWNEDHPEFTKLREQLGKDGFISIERGYWNGDRVLKPFTLNGKKFKKNYRFPSACAMGGCLKYGPGF